MTERPQRTEIKCLVNETKSELEQATGKKYTVYTVEIVYFSRTWKLSKRYNEFHCLYDELKDKYPQKVLKFPGKRLFGNLDPRFVERRRSGLDVFMNQLANDSELFESSEVRLFLEIHDSVDDDLQNSLNDALDSEERLNLGPSERNHARPSDFDFLKVIGKGSFGRVYVARRKADRMIYAVKVLHKAQIKRRNEVRHIMSERNVLVTNIKHPFLVGLHYSFQTANKLYFVLTYLNGGEVFFHLQKEKVFSEPRARFYAAEIGSALGYLHEQNIIYRDLKPENLLLDKEGHVVLTDFGLCKEGVTGKQTTSTFCGTPEYLAPEVIRKEPYDRTVDWWCLGCVLYEMLFGLPPFYSRDHRQMYQRILNDPLRMRNTISLPARNILFSMLHKARTMRLGAKDDFKEFRDHPFFFEINWNALEQRKLEPPFKPKVNGEYDLNNFDKTFTNSPVPDSIGQSSTDHSRPDEDFDGFTYVYQPLEKIGEEK